MSVNRLEVQMKPRNRLIKSLALNLAATIIALYLLVPGGPIYSSGRIDLSFLLLPIIGYFLLRLAAAFGLIYIPSRAGYAVTCILRGAAAAFFFYWVFAKAILLTRVPAFSATSTFLSGLGAIDVFAILFFSGTTLIAVSGLYKMHTRERYFGPLGISLGLFFIGISLWRSVAYFSINWQPFEGIGLILMIGFSCVALSNLGRWGDKSANTWIADVCAWLTLSPISKFVIGAMLAAYLVFLRPFLFKYVSYAFLIEWILICLITDRIYKAIHNMLRERHTAVLIEQDWQKHIQQVDDLIDEDFTKIGLLQREFVESGSRRGLLNYLKQMLRNNNLSDDQINEALISLIEYSDKKIPWYVVWIWRRRKIKQNLVNRQSALNATINKLADWAHPVYPKNRSMI